MDTLTQDQLPVPLHNATDQLTAKQAQIFTTCGDLPKYMIRGFISSRGQPTAWDVALAVPKCLVL